MAQRLRTVEARLAAALEAQNPGPDL
jgi:hypothetical protein